MEGRNAFGEHARLSIRALLQLLRKAAWAPISVLIFHAVIAETPHRQACDFVMHFSGGAAIAYFFFVALGEFQSWFGAPTLLGRLLFAFTMACTVGVFWELGEQFSDTFLGSHIQKSLAETQSDLLANTAGAVSALVVIFLFRWWKRTDRA